MKKSHGIPLILLGTAIIIGCGDNGDDLAAYEAAKLNPPKQQEVQAIQNQYKSVEDCYKDWGKDEKECKPATSNNSGGFVGPRYVWSHVGGYPMAIYPDGTSRALPNSYLARGAQPAAVSALTTPMVVGHDSSAAVAGRSFGVARSVSVSARGGFGATAHGFSAGG